MHPGEPLQTLLEEVVPRLPGVRWGEASGYPCAFLGERPFAALSRAGVLVWPAPADRQRLINMGGAIAPEAGEPVVLPAALLSERGALREWVGRALAYAAAKALPTRGVASARRAKPADRVGFQKSGNKPGKPDPKRGK
jgi:hypothetical protein